MIEVYKVCVPGNGDFFLAGSKIREASVEAEEEQRAPPG